MKIDLSIENLRPIPVAAATILVLHLVASLTFPAQPGVTYFAALLCDAVALYACLRRTRFTGGIVRAQWRLIATFLLCNWAAALLLHLPFQHIGSARFGMGIEQFAALLCVLPLLVALCLPEIGRHVSQDSTVSLWIASLQTLLFVGLCYYTIFDLGLFDIAAGLPLTPFPMTGPLLMSYGIFAAGFVLRLVARSASQWKSLYLPVSVYLAGLGCVGFWGPRWHPRAGSVYYLASDAVILLFALYVGREPKSGTIPRGSANAPYLNMVGPAVFPLVVFYLAIQVAKAHFDLGIGIMGASLALFALRTTSLQAGYRRMQEQMLEDNQMTMLEARIDQLTGIPNRRSFDRTLDREWRRAERTHQPLGLLMVDVDKFKHLNDTQGHPAGDRTLKRIASVLDAKLTRATDFVARYGGEEFSVILTDTSVQDIKAIAESLRAAVAEARLPNATEIGQYVSISIGAALTYPASPLTPSSLLSGADQALYQAKRNGRNQVHFTDLLNAPSLRAQTDGALHALRTDYKESVYGAEPDPTRQSKIRAKLDRRLAQQDKPSSGEIKIKG